MRLITPFRFNFANLGLTQRLACLLLIASTSCSALSQSADGAAAPVLLDQVVAIVENDIIMASEVAEQVNRVTANFQRQGGNVPPASVVYREVLDRMILDNLQIQRANRMGIRISDQELNDALANIARNNGISLTTLRDSVESEGTSFRHFREQLRKEIAIKQLQRRSVIRNIVVTDKEVDNFLRSKKGQQMLTPELFVEHLLLPVSSKADGNAQQQAEAKITSLRQSAERGKSFSQLAQENTASEVVTNDFGWRRTNDMPGIFVEIAASLNKGDISEPIRSDSGFHLIRVKDTRGGVQQSIVETKARHILIKPNAIRSAADSKALIDDIGRQLANGADFAALAKKHSDDPGSALLGGNLDWTKPGQLVPEFQAMMEKTDIQAISPSFETEYGWHILQVLDKRTVDASNDIAKGRARIAIGESKYDDELNRWLQKLRDDAFVEIK